MAAVLVLGALGGVGSAVASAFLRQGWQVKGLVRPARAGELPAGIAPIVADVFDADAVAEAAGAVDVVFNGLNVPYTEWETKAMPMFRAALAVCEKLGALQLFPGNVYNFGAGMPAVLTPQVPFAPTTAKGRMRVKMEAALAKAATDEGVRTIVLRAGDFFGPEVKMSWLDQMILKDLARGVITAPGPEDIPHGWAFLPDLATCFVRLAEQRDSLGAYEVFHFPGHAFTLAQLAGAAETVTGRTLRLRRFPRVFFQLGALVSPMIRAINQMSYLWRVPHRLADPRLAATIGPLPETPLVEALRATLSKTPAMAKG